MMNVFNTPRQIELFRLVSLKSQLKLEQAGLKSSGGALRPRLAAEFGLNKRAPYADYIKAVQVRMDNLTREEGCRE